MELQVSDAVSLQEVVKLLCGRLRIHHVAVLLKRERLDFLGLFLGKLDTPGATDIVLNVFELIRHGDDGTKNCSIPFGRTCRDAALTAVKAFLLGGEILNELLNVVGAQVLHLQPSEHRHQLFVDDLGIEIVGLRRERVLFDLKILNAEIGEGDLVGANRTHRPLVFNLLLKGGDERLKLAVELGVGKIWLRGLKGLGACDLLSVGINSAGNTDEISAVRT